MLHLDLPAWLPIEMCGFSMSTYRVLAYNGIFVLSNLTRLTLPELLKLHKLKEAVLLEIFAWVSLHITMEEKELLPEPDFENEVVVFQI